MSIWNYVFDNEWKQRSDIEANAGLAGEAAYAAQAAANHAERVERTVIELSIAVATLVQMLVEAKVVELPALRSRVDAAIAAAFPRIVAQPAPAAPVEYTCSKCGSRVAAAATIMTGDGVVCDRCTR